MTVRDLIERLKDMNPDAIVRAYDADSEQFEPITGLLFCHDDVSLQTDDNS